LTTEIIEECLVGLSTCLTIARVAVADPLETFEKGNGEPTQPTAFCSVVLIGDIHVRTLRCSLLKHTLTVMTRLVRVVHVFLFFFSVAPKTWMARINRAMTIIESI